MVKRSIIEIDEQKCNGCGECVPNCAEGALQIIDNKARLISDLFCDGLGACIGHCPQNAITVIEREAEPYDEKRVLEERIIPAGSATIRAHLQHLKEHGADDYYEEACAYLEEKGIEVEVEDTKQQDRHLAGGCPGMKVLDFSREDDFTVAQPESTQQSRLGQWPVQIHLLSPHAPYFKDADLVIIADCVAYAYGNTHEEFIRGNAIAIGCPKLDDVMAYVEKLAQIIEHNNLKSIKVVKMEVPCCSGMVEIVKQAIMKSGKVISFETVTIGLQGDKK